MLNYCLAIRACPKNGHIFNVEVRDVFGLALSEESVNTFDTAFDVSANIISRCLPWLQASPAKWLGPLLLCTNRAYHFVDLVVFSLQQISVAGWAFLSLKVMKKSVS